MGYSGGFVSKRQTCEPSGPSTFSTGMSKSFKARPSSKSSDFSWSSTVGGKDHWFSPWVIMTDIKLQFKTNTNKFLKRGTAQEITGASTGIMKPIAKNELPPYIVKSLSIMHTQYACAINGRTKVMGVTWLVMRQELPEILHYNISVIISLKKPGDEQYISDFQQRGSTDQTSQIRLDDARSSTSTKASIKNHFEAQSQRFE
jgi:hypothetical protein